MEISASTENPTPQRQLWCIIWCFVCSDRTWNCYISNVCVQSVPNLKCLMSLRLVILRHTRGTTEFTDHWLHMKVSMWVPHIEFSSLWLWKLSHTGSDEEPDPGLKTSPELRRTSLLMCEGSITSCFFSYKCKTWSDSWLGKGNIFHLHMGIKLVPDPSIHWTCIPQSLSEYLLSVLVCVCGVLFCFFVHS